MSQKSRYIKLTDDEEKQISVLTPEHMHAHDEWLLNIRKGESKEAGAKAGSDSLSDFWTDRYTRDVDDITAAYHTLYAIGLRSLAETVARHVPDKQAKMIEVGVGTGNFGLKLKQIGFMQTDGLEPAEGCVNLIPKNLYGKIYQEFVLADKPTSIPSDTYDYVLAAGAVYSGHLEFDAIPEMIRILRPGGCIIFNIADYWFKYKDFGARMDAWLQSRLEDGTLESVLKERCIYYYNKADCDVYIIKTSSKE